VSKPKNTMTDADCLADKPRREAGEKVADLAAERGIPPIRYRNIMRDAFGAEWWALCVATARDRARGVPKMPEVCPKLLKRVKTDLGDGTITITMAAKRLQVVERWVVPLVGAEWWAEVLEGRRGAAANSGAYGVKHGKPRAAVDMPCNYFGVRS
jgi:hypothetical protein